MKLPLQILDSAGVNPQNPVSKGVTAHFRCFGGFLDRIMVWQPLPRRLAGEGFPRFQVNQGLSTLLGQVAPGANFSQF